MDPNANTRERIELYARFNSLSESDRARLDELDDAYRDWIQSGGFPADQELINRLRNM